MKKNLWRAGLLATALMMVANAQAHHSFAAIFDASKPVRITGKLTKVEWTNPPGDGGPGDKGKGQEPAAPAAKT